MFVEFFDRDYGAGLGASRHTGRTGIVVRNEAAPEHEPGKALDTAPFGPWGFRRGLRGVHMQTDGRRISEAPTGGDQKGRRTGRTPVSRPTVFGWAVAAAGGVAVVAVAAMTLYSVRSVLIQAVIGLFLAVSLDPPVRWMVGRGARRGHAVAIIFLTTLVLTALFLWAFLPPLLSQGTGLTSDFPGYLAHLRRQSPALARLDDRFHLLEHITAWARTMLDRAGHNAWTYGQQAMGAVSSALLVGVLTIYFMLDLPRIRKGLVAAFPQRHRRKADAAVAVVADKVGSYMTGNFAISAIAGVATFIALTALQVPFAVPLAVFVALTDLLPMIGATLGAVVCIVAALATTDLWPNTIVVALFFVVYQQLENYLIAPRVLRNAVQMSALAVLLAALIGGTLLGLIGALMAIPIAAAVKAITVPALRTRRQDSLTTTHETPGPGQGVAI
ncbi:AI-2E family transporter [Streptomyces sp. NPDC001833]|uniref:AI-2E family transporter n=1 Tax=Streptomyces sp. NPDC001833 TaxID=3154658 RepID=UPI00332FF007